LTVQSLLHDHNIDNVSLVAIYGKIHTIINVLQPKMNVYPIKPYMKVQGE